jgi:hypothetical protein
MSDNGGYAPGNPSSIRLIRLFTKPSERSQWLCAISDGGEVPMLDRQSAKEVTELVIIVLLAYHMREAGRLETIIQECGTKNRLHEFWPEFQAEAASDEEALSRFTQFVIGVLDGGDFNKP